MKKAYSLTKTI